MTGARSNPSVLSHRFEPADDHDFFPTPPWATRAFCELVLADIVGGGDQFKKLSVVEPACGSGDMARPLAEYFGKVHASDLVDRGFGTVADFLDPAWHLPAGVDWLITNPPFDDLAMTFVLKALALRVNVAVLVKVQFLETIGRCRHLHGPTPANYIVAYAERLNIFKGQLDGASPAKPMMFVWFVWLHPGLRPGADPRVKLIPACRRSFERAGDYSAAGRGEHT